MISSLPNMTLLVPSTVTGGKVLQGTVGNVFSRSDSTERL